MDLTEQQKTNLRSLVAALRDGSYTQGRGQLRKHDDFCCLGVACDLYQKTTGEGFWGSFEQGQTPHGISDKYFQMPDILGKFSGLPPQVVSEYFGLLDQEVILSGMNDNGRSFPQIADYLEDSYGLLNP